MENIAPPGELITNHKSFINDNGSEAPNNPSKSEIKLFGKDGFTFFDFLDIINPLQHIPFVSSIYRSITGDQIDPGAKIAGATLFGGPIGATLATLDVAVKHGTGQNITQHTANLFLQKESQTQHIPSKTLANNTFSNSLEAKSLGLSDDSKSQSLLLPKPIKTNVALPAPQTNPQETSNAVFSSAGMTAIPIAKTDVGLTSAYKSSFTAPILPDLEALSATKTQQSAVGLRREDRQQMKEAKLKSIYELERGQQTHRSNKPTNPAQPITSGPAGWLVDAMLSGLGKYKSAAQLKRYNVEPAFTEVR